MRVRSRIVLPLATLLVLLAPVAGCRPLSAYDRPPTPAKAADLTGRGPFPSTTPAPSVTVHAIVVQWRGVEGADPQVTHEGAGHSCAPHASNMLRSGDSSFAVLAREYSDDRVDFSEPRTIKKGASSYPAKAEEQALYLLVGQVTGAIDTPQGYFVVERTPDPSSAPVGPSRIRAKHILISFKGARGAAESTERSKDDARVLAEQLREELVKAPDTWDAVAQKHTEEPGAHDGGDLGYFGRGVMVPSFERTAFALKAGQISDVIETPFGFHIILRTE
ncbi:MAG: peptidylprolyl isomerase [Polyangiales bacterium]